MGGFNRVLCSGDANLPHPARVGDGMLSHFAPYANGADANLTVDVEKLAGGHIIQSLAITADRTYTLDTAALIAAAFPEMDIGDSYSFVVTNGQSGAFDIIVAVAAGITLASAVGNVSPQASRVFTLVKTAAATFDLY